MEGEKKKGENRWMRDGWKAGGRGIGGGGGGGRWERDRGEGGNSKRGRKNRSLLC